MPVKREKENTNLQFYTNKKGVSDSIKKEPDFDADLYKNVSGRKSLLSLDKKYLDDPRRAPLYCKEIFKNLLIREVN